MIQQIESVQYKSVLATTGAITGTSKEKLYQELGLETLEKRRWYRKLGSNLYTGGLHSGGKTLQFDIC